MIWVLLWAQALSPSIPGSILRLLIRDGLDRIAPKIFPKPNPLVVSRNCPRWKVWWMETRLGLPLLEAVNWFVSLALIRLKRVTTTTLQVFRRKALQRAEDLLSGGRAWLTFDAECADHYDRTLSYVHVGLGEQYFVQRAMLQGGFATAFPVTPNTTFESDFSEDESLANAGGVGLWGACAY